MNVEAKEEIIGQETTSLEWIMMIIDKEEMIEITIKE